MKLLDCGDVARNSRYRGVEISLTGWIADENFQTNEIYRCQPHFIRLIVQARMLTNLLWST